MCRYTRVGAWVCRPLVAICTRVCKHAYTHDCAHDCIHVYTHVLYACSHTCLHACTEVLAYTLSAAGCLQHYRRDWTNSWHACRHVLRGPAESGASRVGGQPSRGPAESRASQVGGQPSRGPVQHSRGQSKASAEGLVKAPAGASQRLVKTGKRQTGSRR